VNVAAIALLGAAWSSAPTVELGWRVPTSCPDQTTALATIDALLQGHAPREGEALAAEVHITAEGTRFRARVALGEAGADGERVLEAASCREAADAALLIVAMAIDPRIGGAPEAPPDDEPEVPTVEPQTQAAAIPEPAPSVVEDTQRDRPVGTIAPASSTPPSRPRAARRLSALLRASGGVGFASGPGASGVVAIGAAIAGARFRVELDADVWTPRSRRDPGDPSRGVAVIGWSIGARGCGSPLARKLELPLCAGLRGGALRGRGVGEVAATHGTSPWILATAGVGVWGWIRPRFALALDVEGMVALTRPAFSLSPGDFTWRAPAGGVRAIFGPVVRLP
jgi:hypothetical protein